MKYDFKFWEEALWAGAIAALLVVLTALTGLENVDDWRTWAVSLGGGVARAVAGAILARLKTGGPA